MSPFRRRRKQTVGARVRGTAVEAAQSAPQRARELGGAARDVAQSAAQNAPQRARELSGAARDAAQSAAQNAPQRYRELREAANDLDIPWARSWTASFFRENFMQLVMNPALNHYAKRRADGSEKLVALHEPVIMVANHSSHMDTPVILSALPRSLRRRTAVAAAADYFYKNRVIASLVSLLFNTVPIERKGGGLSKERSHLDNVLDDGWNLLLYPEGTRKHGDGVGRVRRGAAVLAAKHNMAIVPIRVTGTAEAMPPGKVWPKRIRALRYKRYPINVTFGEPIQPLSDTAAMIERVQHYFESGDQD